MYPGTKYAINTVIVQETKLPMDFNTPVFQRTFATQSNHMDQQPTQEIYWTNDAPDSLDKYSWNIAWGDCSIRNENEPLTENYLFNCSMYKLCYYFKSEVNDSISFTINTPPYTEIPYEYVHKGLFFGRSMIIANMYISYRLVEMLETEMLRWTEHKGCILSRNRLRGYNGPNQLISKNVGPPSETKLQMCIKPEYFYWTIETIIRNYQNLQRLGMRSFKLLYLFGEIKILNIAEIFPTNKPGESISTYVFNGKTYRRELLNSPNIVFYIHPSLKDVKLLVDELCRLFPDTASISFGIPRFNIRVNDNVCISLGGNNVDKFDNGEPHIPSEYQHIIDNPSQCEYRLLSRYLTGHDVLEECTVNNIKSYEKVLSPAFSSFRQAFKSVGLLSYYDSMFVKLHLRPIIVTAGRKSKKLKRLNRGKGTMKTIKRTKRC
jgi:hypothetical protein